MKRASSSLTIDAVLPHFYRASADRQYAALRAIKAALDETTSEPKTSPTSLATKKDIAAYFRRSERWVDLMAQAGHLPRLRTPGSRRGVRFRWSDVQRLEAAMLVGGAE
jgi:hypothetical protein